MDQYAGHARQPLHFQAISHSWVALHPKAKGVIQFVGGAFFGTFAPTLFYRHLLSFFYEQSYTIIVFPFSFSFNHFKESFFLLREQYGLISELVSMALELGADPGVYLEADRYAWMGHSIGCKYVAMLECASSLPSDAEKLRMMVAEILEGSGPASVARRPGDQRRDRTVDQDVERVAVQLQGLRQDIVSESRLALKRINQCLHDHGFPSHDDKLEDSIFYNLFIKDQVSVLLAPVMSGTDSAIQPKAFADWIDRRGWGVQPTVPETRRLISLSNRFNLLVVARFSRDRLAPGTIEWFYNTLNKPDKGHRESLQGGHLRPLGFSLGRWVINPWFDSPLISTLSVRNQQLEIQVLTALESFMETAAS